MAQDAKYKYGPVVTCQYAHASAQVKGAIISLPTSLYPIVAAADLGAAESGTYDAWGGVYEIVVAAANTLAVGNKVYVDAGKAYAAAAETGQHFGYALTGGGAGATILVFHNPNGTEA